MDQVIIMVVTYCVIAIINIIVILFLINKYRKTKKSKIIEKLDRDKNIIISTPVLSELSKIEALIKSEKLEEKYQSWQRKFEIIKNDRITKINDMIIELDLFSNKKDNKTYQLKLAQTEIEVYRANVSASKLLEEIKEITLSEEKYRDIITKLKVKYRELTNIFSLHKKEYDEITPVIELQFENIEKRFADFEHVMENNEYNDVIHVVKALDSMIDHMGIIIKEVPDLILLIKKIIPKKIEQIKDIYEIMLKQEYPLDYLNIEYNLSETNKNINNILDRIKVLNLEECLFELKTIVEYLEGMFNDFEKEKLSRRVFEDAAKNFENKLNKINRIVNDIYNQIEDIKNMYDLTNKDIEVIDDVNSNLMSINTDFKDLMIQVKNKSFPYSRITRDIDVLSVRLKELEISLDSSLKSLGSMYDDEIRAREQLDEIEELLKQCKLRIRSYKLPIITDNYFVELAEANESIIEIVKELEKKPIVIKTLNIRVDTARDLVLKLYNTTNEMIKTAQLAEMAVMYGNRFRSTYKDINQGLLSAEKYFFKGNYKQALTISINTIDLIEPGIHKKLLNIYSRKN
ncbi:MAG: hypothetical protein GX861_00130 [Tenericutes bacterium]|nr:hypothetical protein [Mycoplasmatota bacterium]